MKKNFINNSFQFFLALSALFHLGLIGVLIVSKSLPKLFKQEEKTLIQNSIRIDSIALPDLPSKPKIKTKKSKTVLIKKIRKNKKIPRK